MTAILEPLPAGPGRATRNRAWGVDALAAVALLVAAVALRRRPLDPHSLWIDDAWVSLLYKVHTVGDVRRISVASPGFIALLKIWFKVVGFSNLRAQLPAFVFGILGPPALYFTARSWRLGRAVAIFAGGLLLVSPVHIRYSTRVKAFTLEALAAAAVLAIADRLLSDPGRASRWYAFGAASVIATVLSAPLVIVCAPGFLAGFVAQRRARGRGVETRPLPSAALRTTAAFGVFTIAWYLAAIRGAIDHNLVAYWKNFYISHHSVGDLLSSSNRAFTRLARGFDPAPVAVTLIALVLCLVWTSRVRPDRAVLLFGPVAIAFVIAVLRRNPLGGGRTDVYLYVDLAMALALGAHAVVSRVPPNAAAVVTVAAVVGLGALALPVPTYPKEDFRAMFAIVQKNVQANDAILLYPKARFAAALYTGWPFHLRGPVAGTSVTTPFDLDIDRPLTYVPADTTPVHFGSAAARATAASRRIWYLGTHGGPDYDRAEVLFRRAGYVLKLRRGFAPHYWLQLWTRPLTKPAS